MDLINIQEHGPIQQYEFSSNVRSNNPIPRLHFAIIVLISKVFVEYRYSNHGHILIIHYLDHSNLSLTN